MIKETIVEARDVNSAIDKGVAELGLSRDDIQFEIISLPRKGFLGLKTYPAKVKVFAEVPDPVQKKPEQKPQPQLERKPAPAPKPAPKPVQDNKPQQDKKTATAPKPVQEKKPQQEQFKPKQEVRDEPKPKVVIEPTQEVREKVERAAAYLRDIMLAMGFEEIEVTPCYYEDNVSMQLKGAQLGVVIGRRGETLDSLQYLVSLVANRGEGEYIRINIDSGNYREKREKTLTALAKKLANQALRTGKSVTLEPMNPYERRVIHGAVSEVTGATSTSVGVDPNRRVVISAAEGAKRPSQGSRGGRRDGSKGRRDNNKPRRDNAARPVKSPVQKQEPVAEATHSAAIKDAEMFADLPIGVPIVPGERQAPKPQKESAPKKAPKSDDEGAALYGKI